MRIEQNSAHLLDLVKQVQAGKVVPAAFQRPYVWEQSDVIALCESILSGYPIGGFLSWVPKEGVDLAKVGRRRLGPLDCAPAENEVALLLDGQNRLASFAWMMLTEHMALPQGLSDAEKRTWASGESLVVDIARRALAFIDADRIGNGFHAPAWVMFGGVAASQCIRQLWSGAWQAFPAAEVEAGVRWLDESQDAFRFARITETILDRATVEEAKQAFLHICRVGKQMTPGDFSAAVEWVTESRNAEALGAAIN